MAGLENDLKTTGVSYGSMIRGMKHVMTCSKALLASCFREASRTRRRLLVRSKKANPIIVGNGCLRIHYWCLSRVHSRATIPEKGGTP